MPAMFRMRIALADADEWEALSLTSRDVMQAEKRFHDFSLTQLMAGSLSLTAICRVAWFAMRREGRIVDDMTLASFSDAYDFSLQTETDDGPTTVDPTSEAL